MENSAVSVELLITVIVVFCEEAGAATKPFVVCHNEKT